MKWGLGEVMVCAALATWYACTPSKSAVDTVVKVTDDLCSEVTSEPAPPDWVLVACKVESVASPIVKVLLPRTEWAAIKARASKVDAGPGK